MISTASRLRSRLASGIRFDVAGGPHDFPLDEAVSWSARLFQPRAGDASQARDLVAGAVPTLSARVHDATTFAILA